MTGHLRKSTSKTRDLPKLFKKQAERNIASTTWGYLLSQYMGEAYCPSCPFLGKWASAVPAGCSMEILMGALPHTVEQTTAAPEMKTSAGFSERSTANLILRSLIHWSSGATY